MWHIWLRRKQGAKLYLELNKICCVSFFLCYSYSLSFSSKDMRAWLPLPLATRVFVCNKLNTHRSEQISLAWSKINHLAVRSTHCKPADVINTPAFLYIYTLHKLSPNHRRTSIYPQGHKSFGSLVG
jgi:hypothetical protein